MNELYWIERLDAVNVTFVVAKGASLENVPATTSPRT